MKTITSKDNPLLKSARKLLTRKGREEAGAFLACGSKLIEEAKAAGLDIEHTFVNAGALLRGEIEAGTETETGALDGAEVIALEEALFKGLAQTVSPQPYIAVVRRGARGDTGDTPMAPPDRVLVLDRLGDPGNVGTIVRTALAAGFCEVWCTKGTADVFSDKAIRASAGAIFHMPVQEGLTALECASRARALGLGFIACDAGGASLYEAGLGGRIAVAIGSESDGLENTLLDAADAVVGIPMAEASESLNAATAAAIVMYEALRQRDAA